MHNFKLICHVYVNCRVFDKKWSSRRFSISSNKTFSGPDWEKVEAIEIFSEDSALLSGEF